MGATRTLRSFGSVIIPALKSAARLERGAMLGLSSVIGIARALNLPLLVRTAPGGVLLAPDRRALATLLVMLRVEPPVSSSGLGSAMSGENSSVAGKGGEEAKRDAIWISAVVASGEAMMAFP